MKKTFKAAVAAIAVALCASFATAEMGMYARLDLGYAGRDVPIYEGETAISAFNLMPAFGLMFAPDSDNMFLKGLGAEAQLDMNFGSNSLASGAVIIPGVMAMWHFYFPETFPTVVQKIVPYTGLGFSIPIAVMSSDITVPVYKDYYGYEVFDHWDSEEKSSTKAGFDINWKLGCGFEVIPQLMLTFDYMLSFGTSYASTVNIGAVYKFKGARNIK
ncbi:MAG: hypothetical protein K2K67_09140 [Treponemataceae bacterium]|nr:hypothetical protein [Treponemataceae bacterium]